jgi:hypothetical protein
VGTTVTIVLPLYEPEEEIIEESVLEDSILEEEENG